MRVRILGDDLERLMELQGRWRDATGEDVAAERLLGLLLRHGEADFGGLTDITFEPPRG